MVAMLMERYPGVVASIQYLAIAGVILTIVTQPSAGMVSLRAER